MARKTTHRPFAALPRLQVPKPAGTKGDAPLAGAGAVPLPERARRVRPPPEPAIIARPRPEPPAFLLTKHDGRVEGVRRGLDAKRRRNLRGTPAATCDLHGSAALEARAKLRAFLVTEHARGRTLVLVIVGRGHRSPGKRPVLANEIVDWLTEPPLAELVLAFHTAPPELGGTGGIVVRLWREPER